MVLTLSGQVVFAMAVGSRREKFKEKENEVQKSHREKEYWGGEIERFVSTVLWINLSLGVFF